MDINKRMLKKQSDDALNSWAYPGSIERGGEIVYSDLAIETCLTINGEREWKVRKYGWSKHRTWRMFLFNHLRHQRSITFLE